MWFLFWGIFSPKKREASRCCFSRVFYQGRISASKGVLLKMSKRCLRPRRLRWTMWLEALFARTCRKRKEEERREKGSSSRAAGLQTELEKCLVFMSSALSIAVVIKEEFLLLYWLHNYWKYQTASFRHKYLSFHWFVLFCKGLQNILFSFILILNN